MNNPAQVKVVGGWALLVLIGIASLTWLQPNLLRGARQERNDLQLRLARAEDGAAEIRALVADLGTLKESTAAIKDVPNQSQFAGLIQDLGSRLEARGIEEREITTGGSVDLGPAKSIPMRLLMKSDFSGAYETIEWVESLPRLIRVQRVMIKSADKADPWAKLVDVEITLDVVFDPTAPQDRVAAVDLEALRE